jgi:hypothetical protein
MSISRPNQTDRLGGLPVSKCFLEVDAIHLSSDRRLQAERTEAAVPHPWVCSSSSIGWPKRCT